MDNLPLSDVFEFLYSIFSSIFNFINNNSLVKWFVFVPIATVFLLVIFYFVFDVSHILDDYKAKNTMLYKGLKNYDKQQAAERNHKGKYKPVQYGTFTKPDYSKYKNQKVDYSNFPYSKSIKYKIGSEKKGRRKNKALDIEVED